MQSDPNRRQKCSGWVVLPNTAQAGLRNDKIANMQINRLMCAKRTNNNDENSLYKISKYGTNSHRPSMLCVICMSVTRGCPLQEGFQSPPDQGTLRHLLGVGITAKANM